MKNQKEKGNFMGLMPLIVFLVAYMGTGLGTGSFDNMPLMTGIAIASGVAMILNKKGEKTSFEEKIEIYCKGGGESTLVLMLLIFLLAGAFGGVAKEMGAVDSIVNLGLTILPGNLILPGIFLIGCLLSFSMGTSMGTVAALMPIAVDISTKTGIGVVILAGAVVGGAMFGDNLSFISDTTIAATRTQEVSMKDKFKANILMVIPAVLINVVLLTLQSSGNVSLGNVGEFNFIQIIPYILVVVLSLVGLNVVGVMVTGILSGVIIGVVNGSFTIVESLSIVHQGAMGMEDMALIAVMVGGMVALMKHFGGMDYLLDKLTKGVKGKRGGELSIAALVSLLDIATTNNTISIIAAGPIARDIADEYGIARARVASILDLFSSAFNGLLPYAGQLLVAGGLAGVSPMSIMPYNWYSMLMIVFGIVFIVIGFPKMITGAKAKSVSEEVKTEE